MKNVHFTLLITGMLTFLLINVSAQEVILTTGNDATGDGGSVSYSIGEVAYSAKSSSSGTFTEGVQQPFEISVLSGIDAAKEIELSLSAYPNPTSDFFILNVNGMDVTEFSSISYQLYDLHGKLLEDKKIKGSETKIVMKDRTPASYILMIFNNNQAVKVFKVIKK